jgi:hypothetical protein
MITGKKLKDGNLNIRVNKKDFNVKIKTIKLDLMLNDTTQVIERLINDKYRRIIRSNCKSKNYPLKKEKIITG